jgi:hypothetical protein
MITRNTCQENCTRSANHTCRRIAEGLTTDVWAKVLSGACIIRAQLKVYAIIRRMCLAIEELQIDVLSKFRGITHYDCLQRRA